MLLLDINLFLQRNLVFIWRKEFLNNPIWYRSCIGHVIRMDQTRVAKRILQVRQKAVEKRQDPD